MELHYYDTLFSEARKQAYIIQKKGLLEITPINLENHFFANLMNIGMYHIQNSVLLEVLDTIMEGEILQILHKNILADYEIKGLFIIQAIIHAFRIGDFDAVLNLEMYYCPK